jgi:hypothetical protein
MIITHYKQGNKVEGIGLLAYWLVGLATSFKSTKKWGWEVNIFSPFPWIIENSSFFKKILILC